MKKMLLIFFLVLSINLHSVELETILNGFAKLITMPNLTGEFSITLVSNSGDTREIKAKAYQKLIENKQMNRMFSFSYPPSVRGTGLLIHSFYDGGENKMWIYLPVVKKIRRIALESAGGGYFMGSDFSYVDFISKSSSEFNLELIGEGELNGRACYIVKEYGNTQEQREALGYSSVINYYDKENYFMFARDYYELSGNLLKTYRVLEQLSFPPYIYPSEIIMTNVQTNHKSIIKVENISTKEVSDEFFTTRYLSR